MRNTLLAILASYRLARMLAIEEGPFSLFERTRSGLGGDSQATWIGRGVSCPLCLGFWISLIVSLVFLPCPSWRKTILNWLGIAGGMTALYRWVDG